MSAPSFTGSEVSHAYDESEPTAITLESAAVSGEGQIAVLWLESTTITPTTPEGWTLLASVAGPGGPFKVWAFGRICDGSAKDDFTPTFTKVACEAGMRRISTAAPVASWIVGATTSSNTKEGKIKAVTTTVADSLAVGLWNTYNGMTSPPASSTAGWTREGSVMLTLTKAITGVESTGEPVITWTASSQNFAAVMVVVPPKEETPSSTTETMLVNGEWVAVESKLLLDGEWKAI